MDKSIWDSYLGEDGRNRDFHFEMDGVETLHLRRWATTSGKLQIQRALGCCHPSTMKILRSIGESETLHYCGSERGRAARRLIAAAQL